MALESTAFAAYRELVSEVEAIQVFAVEAGLASEAFRVQAFVVEAILESAVEGDQVSEAFRVQAYRDLVFVEFRGPAFAAYQD